MIKLSKQLRNRHYFLFDIVLLLLTPRIALFLRLDDGDPTPYLQGLYIYTVVALLVRVIIFFQYNLYRRFWRYADKTDLVVITAAVTLSSLIIISGFFLLKAVTTVPVPRSVPIIDSLLVLLGVGSIRFGSHVLSWQQPQRKTNRRRVLIMGAGDAGALIAREIKNTPNLALELVGFVDDDVTKEGAQIYGFPVLGTRHDIAELAQRLKVGQLIIAMPTASGKVVREVLQICDVVGIQAKTMPGLGELLSGKVSINQIRDVQIEDLLRREPVRTDFEAVRTLIKGKRVLVTGGGGSIGSELCRQIWACNPKQLVLVGHGENSIFSIQTELRATSPLLGELVAVIADIRFPKRIKSVFARYRPQIVFHAAAHKHVPLMEHNPAEAITNNVLGTRNVLAAAKSVNVEQFVMISTDKAVNPTSVMGASKRVAEMLVYQTAVETSRPYVVVRFGNVLGSRGSVVLTFQKQIAAGGPVTVTHPDIERYFMTIPEAVQLVLQASVLGHGNEVFVLDMGEPVKIKDLAVDLIELSGLEVGDDIDIIYTGLRPGEKLYEELFVTGEDRIRTTHEKLFIATEVGSLSHEHLTEQVRCLEDAAERDDREAVLRCLQQAVPEYQPPDHNFAMVNS